MKIFVAWTVDHLDGLTAAALMADNIEELRHISQDMRRATENVKAWAMAVGGAPVLELGVIGAVEVPADRMTELPAIAKKFEEICDGTLSLGVGMTISEAHTAMRYAQTRGGDQIALYTPDMEDALQEHESPSEPDALANLGKAQTGTEEPVGFADGPEGGGEAPPPTDPQHGGANPAEDNAPLASPDMSAGAPQDPNGGQAQPEQQADPDPKAIVIQALQQIKQQAPVLEQMKQTNPEAFEAVKNVVQAMIIMAQGLAQEQEAQEPVQKSEPKVDTNHPVSLQRPLEKAMPYWQQLAPQPGNVPSGLPPNDDPVPVPAKFHDNLDSFQNELRTIPYGNVARRNFILGHLRHPAFARLVAGLPQGQQIRDALEFHATTTRGGGRKTAQNRPEAMGGQHPAHKAVLELTRRRDEARQKMSEAKTEAERATHHGHVQQLSEAIRNLSHDNTPMPSGPSPTRVTPQGATATKKDVYGPRPTLPPGGVRPVKKEELDMDKAQLPMPDATKKPHHTFATGTSKDGKIKVEHHDTADNSSKGTGWNSVRAGQIMSEDGHAVSSRNPGGK
jgi:hypothetical protein